MRTIRERQSSPLLARIIRSHFIDILLKCREGSSLKVPLQVQNKEILPTEEAVFRNQTRWCSQQLSNDLLLLSNPRCSPTVLDCPLNSYTKVGLLKKKDDLESGGGKEEIKKGVGNATRRRSSSAKASLCLPSHYKRMLTQMTKAEECPVVNAVSLSWLPH